MPELPEVETVRAGVEQAVIRKRILSAEIPQSRCCRYPAGPAQLAQELAGATVTNVGRRGKHLLIELIGSDGDELVLVGHLGMSGWMHWLAPGAEAPKHTHLRLCFEGGGELIYVDPRTFGWFSLARSGSLEGDLPSLAKLGPEPLSVSLTAANLESRLRRRKGARIKSLMLDQTFLAGLGNIYSDEVLFRAGLRWDRTAGSLSGEEVRRLHRSIRAILRTAIASRGSTLSDSQYRDVSGEAGGFQEQHAVYARAGKPCRRCGTAIEAVRLGGRHTFFCPHCQH